VTTPNKPLAGVELGGTKCVCILGTGPDDIRAQERVPTTQPRETLAAIEAVLDRWRLEHEPFAALGLASFGPLDLDRSRASYGHITSTTKPGWRDTNLVARLQNRYNVPVGFNTDVNGAALSEGRWGAAAGLADFAYITVGTGVGVGLIVAGQPVFGCHHTELGHIRVARLPGDDWPGTCSFHGACVEGLVSGTAIEARVGMRPDLLTPAHPVWSQVAHTLGQLLHSIVLSTAPLRIIVGGGVMSAQMHLFERVRNELRTSLNGYIEADEIDKHLASYVVPPGLGTLAGPLGALLLAATAAAR